MQAATPCSAHSWRTVQEQEACERSSCAAMCRTRELAPTAKTLFSSAAPDLPTGRLLILLDLLTLSPLAGTLRHTQHLQRMHMAQPSWVPVHPGEHQPLGQSQQGTHCRAAPPTTRKFLTEVPSANSSLPRCRTCHIQQWTILRRTGILPASHLLPTCKASRGTEFGSCFSQAFWMLLALAVTRMLAAMGSYAHHARMAAGRFAQHLLHCKLNLRRCHVHMTSSEAMQHLPVALFTLQSCSSTCPTSCTADGFDDGPEFLSWIRCLPAWSHITCASSLQAWWAGHQVAHFSRAAWPCGV